MPSVDSVSRPIHLGIEAMLEGLAQNALGA